MLEYDEPGGALEVALGELLRHRLIESVAVPAPGAGLEWSQKVPGGETWELLTVLQRFTASAIVANRTTHIAVRDSNDVLLGEYPAPAAIAAAANATMTFAAGMGDHLQTFAWETGLPSPPLVLAPGWTVGSLTQNIDAGDAYTLVALVVRRWSPQRIALAADWLEQRPRSAR